MHKRSSGSGNKAKVLFLAPELPYPVRGGGPLRSASLLEYLANRFSVHAIFFRQRGDPDPAQTIPPGRIESLDVLDLPYHSRHPLTRALRNSKRLIRNIPPLMDRFAGFGERIDALITGHQYQFAVIEHFWCAPYVVPLRKCSRRVILDLHNIESQWHKSLAATHPAAGAWALNRFGIAAAALERRWLPEFDSLLVTSLPDARLVRSIAPGVNVTVYPNALPEIPPPVRQERAEIAFSGNLEYAPNVSAVRYFRDKIWPSLRSRQGLTWRIIGKNPEAIRGIVRGDARIELTGSIEDAVQALAAAQVVVVPLLAGSGTRIKILEAWAAGTPVVSTTIGAHGLECRDREHLLLADAPDRFAGAVSKLLDSPEERARVGAAGRSLYEERYTWPQAWTALDRLFGEHPVSAAF
jgi:glycosyltransferase involved in cell wall biosynthesis